MVSNEPDIATFVCSVIASACNRDPASISIGTRLGQLGMDSFTFVSVIGQVEAVYEVSLTPDDSLALFEADLVRDLVEHFEHVVGRR